jgi:hypothetical protein
MRLILLLVAVLATSTVFAQSIVIKKVELAGENVIVHYELDDSNPNNEYLINLYSSKDNYFAPLTKVTGDVGMEVKPGVNNKITWKIRDEYGGYKGKIALEIRGKVYVPFAKLQGFDTKKTYKRGQTINLKWKAAGSNPIHIELYKGGERVAGDMNVPNNGTHSLFIPKHVATGRDYRLKITDSKNSEEQYYTDNFKVAPKIPTVAKIGAGLVVVGAIVFVVTSSGGSKGKDGGTGNNNSDEIGLPKLPGN